MIDNIPVSGFNKLSDEQKADFERRWPEVQKEIYDRFFQGELSRKKFKNKLFFAKLKLLKSVKDNVPMPVEEKPKIEFLPPIVDGKLVLKS